MHFKVRTALQNYRTEFCDSPPHRTPVSYTHLDVYKRQGFDHAEIISRNTARSDVSKHGTGRLTGTNYPGRSIAVSYTHLDVYKRQIE